MFILPVVVNMSNAVRIVIPKRDLKELTTTCTLTLIPNLAQPTEPPGRGEGRGGEGRGGEGRGRGRGGGD